MRQARELRENQEWSQWWKRAPTRYAPDGKRLSARHRQLFVWLGRGWTMDQIASRLGIQPLTVQQHLKYAYRSLGVSDRMTALGRLIARGEIMPHELAEPAGESRRTHPQP